MKNIKKILSVILVTLMFLGTFSVANPVIAADIQEKEEVKKTAESLIENADRINTGLFEIKEERDAYTKVFLTENGTKRAIVSSTPVHYLKNGEWIEIDNELKMDENKKNYKNIQNSFTAYLPEELTAYSNIKLEKGEYSVEFVLDGTDIFKSQKSAKGKQKVKSKTGKDEFDFLDKKEKLSFEGVGQKTDIDYVVTSTGIKENIILNSRPDEKVVYNYKIKTENLSAKINKDKSISFTSNNNEEIFNIPAPVMYDCAGLYSDDIKVAFYKNKGEYILTYEPSYEWLQTKATYPVVVDPVINTTEEGFSIIDATVASDQADTNLGDSPGLVTGYLNNAEYISYIDIYGTSVFDFDLAIKSVSLYVYNNVVVSPTNISKFDIAVFPITEDWNEKTVTYSNRPAINRDNLLDKRSYNGNVVGEFSMFDVTEAFTSNYTRSYGVAIKMRAEMESKAGCAAYFTSSEYIDEERSPYFVIEYYETQGVEEQFDYHIQSAGRAGNVYFNDYTNQIYIERDELGLNGLKMPVQIKRYYNSNAGGTISTYNIAFFGMVSSYGYGWKTNYNQILQHIDNIDGEEYILYLNGEGTTTYFKKSDTISNGKRKWIETVDIFSNEKGYELWLNTQNETDLPDKFVNVFIKDSEGKQYDFNEYGFLTAIHSAEEDSNELISVNYLNDSGLIENVIDGAGREYRFTYSKIANWDHELLTSIQAYSPNGNPIKVKDANNNDINYKFNYAYTLNVIKGEQVPVLSSVTYPDGESVYYNVTDNNTSVRNIDGYTLDYSFTQDGCVISEKVYSNDNDLLASGGTLAIARDNAHQKTFTDANNVTQTKQFDLYGRTISVINADGVPSPRVYSEECELNSYVYDSLYLDYETPYVADGENIVIDGSFDVGLSSWDVSHSDKVTRVTNADCNPYAEIKGSLMFTGGTGVYRYAIQTIPASGGVSGDSYNLTFANKSYRIHHVEDWAYISWILVQAKPKDDTWTNVAKVAPNPFNNKWQKYSFDFDIDFDYEQLRIYIVHNYQYGRTWYDDISLVNTYTPTSGSNSDDTSSDEITSCSCEYCKDNCSCKHSGSDVCTFQTCPDCGECTCEGCTQLDCPCRDCSAVCNKVSCKRGYTYTSTSSGSFFSVTDGEKEMSATQNVNGNYYSSQSDMNGINTFYNYNQLNGQLHSVTNGNDYVTSYTYDAMSHLRSVTTSVSNLNNGNVMNTSYTYDNDRVDNISHNGFSYNYEYDAWGNISAVKVQEQPLISYNYDSGVNRNRVNRITYGNGDYTDYVYDNDENISTIKSYFADGQISAEYEYVYDTNGMISLIRNKTENTEIRYSDNNISIVLLNGSGEADDELLYATQLNEDEDYVEVLGDLSYTKGETSAEGDVEKGTTTSQTTLSSEHKEYKFDSVTDYFGRQNQKKVSTSVSQNQSLNFETSYKYKDLAGNKTTSLVSSYRPVVTFETDTGESEQTLFDWEYLYTYDTNGNVVNISVNIPEEDFEEFPVCSYTYDEAGQLVRENNAYTEKTYVYVYDKGGNITQKTEYDYTEGSLGTPLSTVNYTYDSVWKDKLSAYNGTAIETDSIGNPLNSVSVDFLGNDVNATLEWSGRQLASATVDDVRYEYTYDSNGMRTRMAVRDTKTNALATTYYYFWEGGKLRGYTITDETGTIQSRVKMLFDGTDDSVGYELYLAEEDTTKTYFFLKNLQGDITNVYNENGEDVLQYAYDAWGNVTILFDMGSFEDMDKSVEAAVYTPITYRGYMYDFYTGLYYLQSRYYNPLYGRFLNADDTAILEQTIGTLHGANLFAYCNNDPIMNVDYTGMYAGLAIMGAGVSVMSIVGSLVLIGVLVILLIWAINPELFQVDGIEFSLSEIISKWKILCAVTAFKLVNVTIPSLIKDIDGRLTKYKYRNGQQEHHIAPQKVFLYIDIDNTKKIDSVLCSYYLKEANIDINSPINKVWLNASFHSALNTNIYYSAVYQLTKSFFDVMNKIGVYLALVILRVFLIIFNHLYMIRHGGVI